jgi:hypothetical protein
MTYDVLLKNIENEVTPALTPLSTQENNGDWDYNYLNH